MKTEQQPLISMVLAVYNGEPYLKEAIDSVLRQSLADFELIIINDGSKDDSDATIKSFGDPRIRYSYQKNQGLAATLNTGIRMARGKYIARQDQDDVSAPKRFEEQVRFLEAHPRVGIVGSWARIMVETRPTDRSLKHPLSNAALQFGILFDSRLVHPSVMIRREVFDTVGYYSTDPKRQPPEDYELWSRIARSYELANIPEYLLTYREVEGSMSRDPRGAFMDRVIMISGENIANVSSRSVDDPMVRALAGLIHRQTVTAVPLSKVLGFLHSLAPEGGASEELSVLMAAQEELIRHHYQHGVLYKVARKVKGKLRKLVSSPRND